MVTIGFGDFAFFLALAYFTRDSQQTGSRRLYWRAGRERRRASKEHGLAQKSFFGVGVKAKSKPIRD